MRRGLLLLLALYGTAEAAPSAEDHFDAGELAYHDGDYARAIAEYQESYRLSQEPALLYNLGQAYRLAGDCPNALTSYRRYLELTPTSEQSALARGFIGELEPVCGRRPPVVDTNLHPAPASKPEDQPRSHLKWTGIGVGGAGVVLLASGLVLGKHAGTLGDRVSTACATSCDWGAQRGTDAAGRRDATIGYALDAVGVAAITSGAILYVLGGRSAAIAVEPRAREGGAVVTWTGRW